MITVNRDLSQLKKARLIEFLVTERDVLSYDYIGVK